MEYKSKIFIVLLFSIVVVASLTSIIFGVGSLVDLLYMEVEDPIIAEESTIPSLCQILGRYRIAQRIVLQGLKQE